MILVELETRVRSVQRLFIEYRDLEIELSLDFCVTNDGLEVTMVI